VHVVLMGVQCACGQCGGCIHLEYYYYYYHHHYHVAVWCDDTTIYYDIICIDTKQTSTTIILLSSLTLMKMQLFYRCIPIGKNDWHLYIKDHNGSNQWTFQSCEVAKSFFTKLIYIIIPLHKSVHKFFLHISFPPLVSDDSNEEFHIGLAIFLMILKGLQ